MKKRINILRIFFILFLIVGRIFSQEQEIEIKQEEEIDIETLYKLLKEKKRVKEVNIYYQKKIIKQGVEDKKGYLKHLLSELEKALKKGKKYGEVTRVEGNLVEIDKGAIHKVRERDVYIVYDSSGNYKGKIEIGAIADAISIGRSYEIKKGIKIKKGDRSIYRGQRKVYEIGLEYANDLGLFSEKVTGPGVVFRYTFRGGWGFKLLITYFYQRKIDYINSFEEYFFADSELIIPFGFEKYFFYPYWVSPYIGVELGYGRSWFGYRKYPTYEEPEISEKVSKRIVSPVLNLGVRFSNFPLIWGIGVRYFCGPELHLREREYKMEFLFPFGFILMGW